MEPPQPSPLDAAAEARRLSAELTDLQRELERVLGSTSWRLTAPLRAAGRLSRKALSRIAPRPGTPPWRLLRRIYRTLPLRGETKARFVDWLVSRGLLAQGSPAAERRRVGAVVTRGQEAWPFDRPLVSVVVPCFNYGRFVSEAIASILAQTFADFEILVVDGGSTDGATRQLLAAAQWPRTQIHLRAGRSLVGDNRNFGIRHARGKYICCLDADDRLKPTYLEKALFLLETQGYDVVSTAIERFEGSTEVFSLMRYPALADLARANQVATCAVFRRDLWERAGGFSDNGLGRDYVYEDWRLWVRFAALGARIANLVDEPLFHYRSHGGSLSRQEGIEEIEHHRRKISAANRDLLSEEAYRRSETARDLRVQVTDPLLNLRLRQASQGGRPAILLAVPFLIVGGAERLLSEIAAHLSRRGYRLLIVSTVHVEPAFGDCTDWFEPASREIYHLPRFLEPALWRDFVFSQLAIKDVQALWIVGSAFFYGLLPEIKRSFPRLKVLDLLFNTVVHAASNRKQHQHIDLTLVENAEVRSWLLKHGERPERMRLIESGVDLDLCRPRPERSPQLLSKLGIPAEAFIVGFSGRLSEEKSPESFLDLAAALRGEPNVYFLMTGAGPLVDEVRRRALRLGLRRRFHFLGRVDDVHSYLAIYDALILPSRFDGRPVVVLESLAMGVPVIASRVGALPELIREGETGFLCKPGNVRAFAERVRWLASHPEEHRRMRAAARAFAEEHLDARRMLEAYAGAVGELLETSTIAAR